MSKRLEIALLKFLCDQEWEIDDEDFVISNDFLSKDDIKKLAQHFYILALEDMRKEVERRYKINMLGSHCAYRNGKCETLREIIDFIDKLTK